RPGHVGQLATSPGRDKLQGWTLALSLGECQSCASLKVHAVSSPDPLPRDRQTAYSFVMDRVGVIGLGKMGLPIAQNLMDRGFGVIGYRRRGSPRSEEDTA